MADDQPTEERWLPIPGYEGYYEVSDHGRVRSVDRIVPHGSSGKLTLKGKALKQGINVRRSVPFVVLTKQGRAKTVPVHCAVAEAFIGPRPEETEVCHRNDDPADNRLSNLRYGSKSENMRDAVKNGRHKNAAKTHCIRGHEFSPSNTIPNSGGNNRACRQCARDRGREWARKNREKRHPAK